MSSAPTKRDVYKRQLYGQCNAEMISSAVTGVDFHPVALNRVYKDAKKSV